MWTIVGKKCQRSIRLVQRKKADKEGRKEYFLRNKLAKIITVQHDKKLQDLKD